MLITIDKIKFTLSDAVVEVLEKARQLSNKSETIPQFIYELILDVYAGMLLQYPQGALPEVAEKHRALEQEFKDFVATKVAKERNHA